MIMDINQHFNSLPSVSTDKISLGMAELKMGYIKLNNVTLNTAFLVVPIKLIALPTRKGLENKNGFNRLILIIKCDVQGYLPLKPRPHSHSKCRTAESR